MNIKKYIREIPDWPKKGVNFKDITPLLQNPEAFSHAVHSLTAPYKKNKPDVVVGIDARGFILAAPVALALGASLVLIRKKGKLPYKTISIKYNLEYGTNKIEIHNDAIKKGQKILIVDDVLATGGTMKAATMLVNKLSGKIIGISFLINLTFLNGQKKLHKFNITSVIDY